MARTTLSQLKQSLKSKSSSGAFSDIWNAAKELNENESANIRFLPYLDPVSGGFWTIRKTLPVHFSVNGGEAEKIYVPCREMYDDSQKCPVTNVVREIYNEAKALKSSGDEEGEKFLREVAKEHYLISSYFFQGFIDGGTEIIPIQLPKQAFNVIDNYVKNIADCNPAGEFEAKDIVHFVENETIPEGYKNSDDFVDALLGSTFAVKKRKVAGQNNYSSSDFMSNRNHEFTEEQIQTIGKSGLLDLTKFLPKRPSDDQYEVYAEIMKQSIEAMRNGKVLEWDAKWEASGIAPYRKDNWLSDDKGGEAQEAPVLATLSEAEGKVSPKKSPSLKKLKEIAEKNQPEEAESTQSDGTVSAKDLLARIKDRKAA